MDRSTIPEVIAELREKLKLTRRWGPWVYRDGMVIIEDPGSLKGYEEVLYPDVGDSSRGDIELVVAAVNALPKLLAYVAKLETTVTTLEKQAADWREEEEHARMDRNLEDT